MLLDSVFTRFVEQKPFSVMARAALERMLSASRLDELFRTHTGVQYERELLFSQLVEVIARVAACAAIEQIKDAVPQLDDLHWTLRAARRTTLQATWTPLSVEQLRGIAECPTTRLVRNGRELQEVILESLGRLQQLLHGER